MNNIAIQISLAIFTVARITNRVTKSEIAFFFPELHFYFSLCNCQK
jgi:hypothetical protein